jgi:hypothetical protein
MHRTTRLIALLSVALIAVAGILGRWVQRRFSQQFVIRWGVALLFALPFGLVWAGYSLLMSQAMNIALHPATAREVFTFTWALPMTIALPAYSFGGLAMQVGAAAVISTVVLVYVGEALAWNNSTRISRYN